MRVAGSLHCIPLLFGALACVHADPVVSDPAQVDAAHPPALVETAFESGGAALNAIVYRAQGPGPHPTAVLLHGFPGNERNLDLAQAIRRSGWNVVFFHYRGAWGSGGDFSFVHALEDTAAVVAAVRSAAFTAAPVDAGRIALVGHSMGGFVALVSAAEVPGVRCVASIAGANLGGMGAALRNDPEGFTATARLLDSWSGPIRGPGGAALLREAGAQGERFDTRSHAQALAGKPLLLLAGRRDVTTPPAQHHRPLVEALRLHGASRLVERELDADHAFSSRRIRLAREVVRWLGEDCR